MQEPRETLDQFHTRLRTLAQTCEFTSPDFEIEEQIIIGGASSKIRKRALRDPSFNLAAMLLEGRHDEQSAFQAKEIKRPPLTKLTPSTDRRDVAIAVDLFPIKVIALRKANSVKVWQT